MAQILKPETMARLNAIAGELAAAATEEARAITFLGDGSAPEAVDQAVAVNAVVVACSAILQSMPLNQLGVVVAMGAVYGTVLGQCDGDRRLLHSAFQKQCAATLAEVAAARMPAQGNA